MTIFRISEQEHPTDGRKQYTLEERKNWIYEWQFTHTFTSVQDAEAYVNRIKEMKAEERRLSRKKTIKTIFV